MAQAGAKHTRSWWRRAVSRWERGGQDAQQFASREGVTAATLKWWRSQFRVEARGAGASCGTLVPLVVDVVDVAPRVVTPTRVEIAVGEAVVRVEAGTDVEYVVALVRGLGGRGC